MADQVILNASLADQGTDFPVQKKVILRLPDVNGGSYISSQINFNLPALTTSNSYCSMRDFTVIIT